MNSEHEVVNSILLALPLPGLTHGEALIVEFTWLVMAVIIIAITTVAMRLKTVPGGFQNFIELLTNFVEDSLRDFVGPLGYKYFPLVMTVFLFIGVSNYFSLLPGCLAPTSAINTTAAWAIVVFLFYNYVGVTKQGFKYFKKFLGPMPAIAPLMLVIEIISEFARPFSLAVRLFANILCGEKIIGLLYGACGILVPVVWMSWESLITAPIQAYVFSLLTMLYLAGAVVAEEH